jgi:hypothetical protein
MIQEWQYLWIWRFNIIFFLCPPWGKILFSVNNVFDDICLCYTYGKKAITFIPSWTFVYLLITIYDPVMQIFGNMERAYYVFIMSTMSSVFVFHQQCLMIFASRIAMETRLCHFFPAWTCYSSLNSNLWFSNENI